MVAVRDRLALLLDAAERLTVDLIAQPPVTVDPRIETPSQAFGVAMREKFDVLPVREADGRIIRYVRREAIEGHRSELDWVRIELSDIHPDEIVSAASPLSIF